jgi:hypothetical protein
MNAYDMDRQLKKGEAAERYLDSLFGSQFDIRRATRAEQRKGIDRIFTRPYDGKEFRIEYKADKTAAKTGNAFVETVSVDTDNIPGWALTCQADYILYYIVGTGRVYVMRPKDIQKRLKRWAYHYPERHIPNGSYQTIGLLVPLHEFEQAAVKLVGLGSAVTPKDRSVQ